MALEKEDEMVVVVVVVVVEVGGKKGGDVHVSDGGRKGERARAKKEKRL